jgi:hypothetical protein
MSVSLSSSSVLHHEEPVVPTEKLVTFAGLSLIYKQFRVNVSLPRFLNDCDCLMSCEITLNCTLKFSPFRSRLLTSTTT